MAPSRHAVLPFLKHALPYLLSLYSALLVVGTAHGQLFFISREVNQTTVTYDWSQVIAAVTNPGDFINVGSGTVRVDIDSLDFPSIVVYKTDNFFDELQGGLFLMPNDSTELDPTAIRILRVFPKQRRAGMVKCDTLVYERRGNTMRESRNGKLTGRTFIDPFETFLPIGKEGHKHPTQAEMKKRLREGKKPKKEK